MPPSAYKEANNRNTRELDRLRRLIGNLQKLNNVTNNWNDSRWLNEFEERNINHFKALYAARKRNPAAYNISKLRQNRRELLNKQQARRVAYGYVPKMRSNWTTHGGQPAPPSIPRWEVMRFRRNIRAMPTNFNSGRFRNAFTKEGTLKAPSGKKPVPFVPKKPVRGFVPTLKELAWKAKSSNENFETVKTMNNKQLKLLSKVGPFNWTAMKPKRRANPLPNNNVTRYRREAAARVIQRTVKRRQKPSQGFLLRTNSARAREAELGIGAGAHRASGPANNTRVTWTRRANGTINRHNTLEKLNLKLSKVERNALNKMPETNAIAYIRNLARAH
jgi:hypothetical protein